VTAIITSTHTAFSCSSFHFRNRLHTKPTIKMNTLNLNSIPDGIRRRVLSPLLDGPSYGSLRQVSRRFSGPEDDGDWHFIGRIVDFALNKFCNLICDIRAMARGAETYTEVVERSKTMAENAMDPGMVDDVRMIAYDKLLDRLLGRATDTIAYSENCALEGAGSKDFFRIWALVEAEAYL
jgi:hypothetical protein